MVSGTTNLPLQNRSVTDITEHNHLAFCGLSITYCTFKSWKSSWSLFIRLPPASTYQAAEMLAFKKAQQVRFPEDYVVLTEVRPDTPTSSSLPFPWVRHNSSVPSQSRRTRPLGCSLYSTWSKSPYCKVAYPGLWHQTVPPCAWITIHCTKKHSVDLKRSWVSETSLM